MSKRATTQVSEDDDLRQALEQSLREHRSLPYLFIGSGLSRRYLGLPDWLGMLRNFASDIGIDFDYVLATAEGDAPRAASLLAERFHPIWWEESRYASQREEFKAIVRDSEGAFKVAVAEYFRSRSTLTPAAPGVADSKYAAELDILRRATIDGVITTNYDNLTDHVFPDFKAYVGQDDLILSDAQFVAETYKIHGSCEQPDSLILTERDYVNYHARSTYLAAKLLTIFAEHPVIFVGYSLTDNYIREIIESIALAVGPDKVHSLQSQIYFVEWNSDPTAVPSLSTYYIDLKQGHSLPAMRIETHSFVPVFEALERLERPFPAKLLRQLREHVFELVTHPDPDQARETVRAVPFDSTEASDLRVVFGIGMFSDKDLQDITGLSGRMLTRDDLAQDLLEIRNRRIDARNVLLHGLPAVLQYSSNAYLPVYKYLREAGYNYTDAANDAELPESVRRLMDREPHPSPYSRSRYERQVQNILNTPKEVMAAPLPRYIALDCLMLLDSTGFEVDELKHVLISEHSQFATFTVNERTCFYKALAYYDRLAYRC